MRIDPGTEFGTLSSVASAMVEVPETGTYRSADGTISRFYRGGDRVSRAEFDLLQMGGVEEVAGDVVDEPAAKAAPKPSNKKAPAPEDKSE